MPGREPDSPVDRAVRAVRRERFLPPEQMAHAGEDNPLPIGYAQTISQPSLVASMTEILAANERSRVLEIGTGSGYQTAILAEIAADVFTIERIPELAAQARARLTDLGYRNIQFRIADGANGWPEAAPFDAIMVTAAAVSLPPAWLEQLAPGGRLLAPVGSVEEDNQRLVLVERDREGRIRQRDLHAVRFVPLITDVVGREKRP
jgi:protein-L-isoaspartate(D-aspartate) O-methyltransferase